MINGNWVLAASLSTAFVGTILTVWVVRAGWRWYEDSFQKGIGTSLHELFVLANPRQLLWLSVWVTALGSALAWFFSGSVVLAAMVAIALPVLPWQLVRTFRKQRQKRLLASLPDAVMLFAGNLRSGSSLQDALAKMTAQSRGPVAQEFALLLSELRLGVTFDAALTKLDTRIAHEDITILVAAMKIARDTGGNLAETLERLANTLRRKAEIEGKIAALTAQGRLQGWVMSALPLVLMVVLYYMEPVAMSPLLHTWYGWLVLIVIVIMELAGIALIRKIVSIDI